MKRTLALAAVLIVALAGCAPTEEVVEPSPVPTIEPSPSATPQTESGLAQPEQVFGGECSALLSEADASAIVGSTLTITNDNPLVAFETVLVWQAGGIRCNWENEERTVGLSLTAAPARAVGQLDEPAACEQNRRDVIGDITCGVQSEVNEIVVAGIVGFGGGASAAAKKNATTMTAALTAAIESNSTVDMAPPVTLPAPGAWANPGVAFDRNPPACADLDSAIVSSDFMGGGTRGILEDVLPVTGYLTLIDSDLGGFETNEPSWCYWSATRTEAEVAKGQISQITSRTLGGGAWVLDLVSEAAGAKEITIDGVDRAYRVTDEAGHESIWVADGPNAASFGYKVGEKDPGYGSVVLVIDALNALEG